MEASVKPEQRRAPPAKYRLNRRAALVLSATFLALGVVACLFCVRQFDPQNRLNHLRESAAEFAARKHWKQAAIQLNNVVRLDPEDADGFYQLGKVYLQIMLEEGDKEANKETNASNFQAAVACYRKTVELDPGHAEAHRWLLELAVRGGNWREAHKHMAALEAISVYDPLLKLTREIVPTRHESELARAKDLANAHPPKWSEVIAMLSPICEQEPDDLDLLGMLATAHTKLGHKEQREKCFERTHAAIGRCSRLTLIRAECAAAERDWQRAIELAEQAANARHTMIAARRIIAESLMQQSQEQPKLADSLRNQAIEQYRKILEKLPGEQCAASNAGWLLGIELGQPNDGLAITTPVVAASGNTLGADLADTHGWLLVRAGYPERGIDYLQQAERMAPERPDILFHLTAAHSRLPKGSEQPIDTKNDGQKLRMESLQANRKF